MAALPVVLGCLSIPLFSPCCCCSSSCGCKLPHPADANDALRDSPPPTPRAPGVAPAVAAGVVEGRARRGDELAAAAATAVAWFTEGGGVTSHGSSLGLRFKTRSAEEVGAAERAEPAGLGVSGPAGDVVAVSRLLLLIGWLVGWRGRVGKLQNDAA